MFLRWQWKEIIIWHSSNIHRPFTKAYSNLCFYTHTPSFALSFRRRLMRAESSAKIIITNSFYQRLRWTKTSSYPLFLFVYTVQRDPSAAIFCILTQFNICSGPRKWLLWIISFKMFFCAIRFNDWEKNNHWTKSESDYCDKI